MRLANCFSVSTASTMKPSRVRKRLAVTLRLTEPLPIWRCSMPATVYSETGPGMKASAASSMATSTSCPRPVCVRWKSALATARAAVTPPMVSQIANPARVGPLAGSPVIDMIPDIACSLPSKAAVVFSGPVRPKPETPQ